MATKEEIGQEYGDLCTALGDLDVRIEAMQDDRKTIIDRLRVLMHEAAQLETENPSEPRSN